MAGRSGTSAEVEPLHCDDDHDSSNAELDFSSEAQPMVRPARAGVVEGSGGEKQQRKEGREVDIRRKHEFATSLLK